MTEGRLSRVGPLCGILFVVLELVGVAVGSSGGRAMVTLGDPTSKVVKAYADPVGNGVWVGTYMELLALAAFVVFAVWLLRPGAIGTVAVASYAGVILVSLVIGAVLEYRAGHGLGAQEAIALFDIQAGLFVLSWGISGAILLLAPVDGWLRRTAVVLGGLLVLSTFTPKLGAAQFPTMLLFVWVLAASTKAALATRPARPSRPLPHPASDMR